MVTTEQMNKSFLEEYNSQDALKKYSTDTAGVGVNYLIDHDYGKVYDDAIALCRQTSTAPLRILEYGCGAGMNIIGLLTRLQRRGIAVERAYGTDFSEALIRSAQGEARKFLPESLRSVVSFHVARNERLTSELSTAVGLTEPLQGRFDLIFGVNTFRYCHRFSTEQDCANELFGLLRPGGASVMIDMNDRFPLFRSRFRGGPADPQETYLPSLEEYSRPFERAGFEVVRKGYFCWIPHSAGASLTRFCRLMTPVLNATVRSRAMRSLVIARKPTQ
jgi:SAM-dependent methyltransferase